MQINVQYWDAETGRCRERGRKPGENRYLAALTSIAGSRAGAAHTVRAGRRNCKVSDSIPHIWWRLCRGGLGSGLASRVCGWVAHGCRFTGWLRPLQQCDLPPCDHSWQRREPFKDSNCGEQTLGALCRAPPAGLGTASTLLAPMLPWSIEALTTPSGLSLLNQLCSVGFHPSFKCA